MRKQPNERLPFGYGRAYFDFMRGEYVYYPIPINWIVGLGIRVHYFLAAGMKTLRPRISHEERAIVLREAADAMESAYWQCKTLNLLHAAALLHLRASTSKEMPRLFEYLDLTTLPGITLSRIQWRDDGTQEDTITFHVRG